MGLVDMYNYLNTELADKRSNDWILVSSPIPVILITFAYLYFVLRYGPRFMENRKPYSLLTFIRFYNIFQIVANAAIVYHILDAGWYQDCFIYCVVPDYSTNRNPMKLVRISWYLLSLKIIDYIETGVFVLRKKWNQISFLHLYHHVSTVVYMWFILKYFTCNMSMTIGLLNSAVHVIMYSYYYLASIGPHVQKKLQVLKQSITIIQLTQFVIMILYMSQAFIPGCPGMRIPSAVMLINIFINFYLFYDFYQKTYTVKKQKA
ncbi:elongation of very long chain fatty acids protein 7-like [Hylaeus anthracinus]|uniref:elongation of very long chain fatty acids protein 7-like n=1 Tax=Hylaeus anthracinus TaxID=313031 RepID=UPI0023B9720C|nr:elongation of very long chain fatty acids protein 7-like [Hylaeus anthracinus]